MFIYHSPPGDVRVTVVGKVDREKGLMVAVSRCSKNDSFQKKTIVKPGRDAFEVQTAQGPKVIPARPEETIKGGVQIATERLEEGKVFIFSDMTSCSSYQFNHVAEGVANTAIQDMKWVEENFNGK